MKILTDICQHARGHDSQASLKSSHRVAEQVPATRFTCFKKSSNRCGSMHYRLCELTSETICCNLLLLFPSPAAVTPIADAVHEHFVLVAAPVVHAFTIGLQKQTVLVQRRGSRAAAQDHVVPTSAGIAALARAKTRGCRALVRAVRPL